MLKCQQRIFCQNSMI